LATGQYTEQAVKLAKENKDFVIGFICQKKLADDPDLIHMTPGVQLEEGTDQLGQQYSTPERVILKNESDVIIVGRGIYAAADPEAIAKKYREAGWNAYLTRVRNTEE
jgi:uridine monophosphate synthetase